MLLGRKQGHEANSLVSTVYVLKTAAERAYTLIRTKRKSI